MPESSGYRLVIDSTLAEEVTGPVEIMLHARPDAEIQASLHDVANDVWITDLVTARRNGDGWIVEASFPESGSYEIEILGRTPDIAVNTYYALALANIVAKLPPVSASDRLLRALRLEDPKQIQAALEAGADANMPVQGYVTRPYPDGNVAVDGYPVFAVLSWYEDVDRRIEALRILKSHGADFRLLTSRGETVISQFFWNLSTGTADDRLRLLKTLLELGADPSQDTAYDYLLDNKPVHETTGILKDLISHGRGHGGKFEGSELATFVPLLVGHGAKARIYTSSEESTLEELFNFYVDGEDPFVKALIEVGVDPNPEELQAMVGFALSPAFNGDFDLISFVLTHTTHANDLDRRGHTLVDGICARRGASTATCRPLIGLMAAHGVDFHREDREGRTALMSAFNSLDVTIIDSLLANGVDPKRRSSGGQTVFHAIPADEDVARLEPLIDRFLSLGVDINARDALGQTALYQVAESDARLELVRFLVSRGADPGIASNDGLTALGNAKFQEQKKLTAYLASLRIPETKGGWPVGNSAPACVAVLNADHAAIARIPAVDFQTMTARAANGVPATPLHLAAEGGRIDVIEALTTRNVDWNVRDRYGRTPLELAVLAGKAEAVAALVKGGADPVLSGTLGDSALSASIATKSPTTRALLAAAKNVDWAKVSFETISSASIDVVKALSPLARWTSRDLDNCIGFARTDILEYLGNSVSHDWVSGEELRAEAQKRADLFRSEESSWTSPLNGRAVAAEMKGRKGSYLLTLRGWSPWMEPGDSKLDWTKYPVAVYVPHGYDGSRPFGLIVSMMNALSASQFPKPEYVATLDAHDLLYVGFDPYNGIFEKGSSNFP
ncbi:MAG: ankyrin repeat domain-containing protein, partial [Spirochaetia bacterium]